MPNFLKASDSLDLWFTTLKNYINEELSKTCDNLKNDIPERLQASIAYSLLAPGKRLRPVLVYLAAASVGDGNLTIEMLRKITPSALSVEMIHAYSLIHDDLPAMDDDDLRRGRPTNHRQFDEATAILAGDALQALAFEMISEQETDSPETLIRVLRVLSRAAGGPGMVGGQMDDLYFTPGACRSVLPMTLLGCFPTLSQAFCQKELESFGNSSWRTDLRALESMQDRKTGALITAAISMGALLANATEEQLFHLGLYGQYLGLMFQITDDILDATSTEETMGKKVGKDDEKGKTTWVNHLGIDASRSYVSHLRKLAEEQLTTDGSFTKVTPLVQLLEYVAGRTH